MIPAAGRGTRVRDVRGELPKECVDICGLPMIAHALLEMSLSGIEEVAVVVAPRKRALTELLGRLPRFPSVASIERLYTGGASPAARHAWPRITVTVQREPRGVIDALATARGFLRDDDFALVMPDNLLVGDRPVTGLLADAYASAPGAWIAFTPVARAEAVRLGNCGRIDLGEEVRRDGSTVYPVRALHPKGPGVFARPPGVETIHRAVGRSIMPATFADPDHPAWDPQPGTGELDDAPRFGQLAREGRLRAVGTPAALYDLGQPAGIAAARSALPQLT